MLTGAFERFGEQFFASGSEWNDHSVETFERSEFVLLFHLSGTPVCTFEGPEFVLLFTSILGTSLHLLECNLQDRWKGKPTLQAFESFHSKVLPLHLLARSALLLPSLTTVP